MYGLHSLAPKRISPLIFGYSQTPVRAARPCSVPTRAPAWRAGDPAPVRGPLGACEAPGSRPGPTDASQSCVTAPVSTGAGRCGVLRHRQPCLFFGTAWGPPRGGSLDRGCRLSVRLSPVGTQTVTRRGQPAMGGLGGWMGGGYYVACLATRRGRRVL